MFHSRYRLPGRTAENQKPEATPIGGDYTSRDGRRRHFITMTNQERIQARIARDKARKAEKRKAQIEQHGTFTNVITMQALLRSLQRRRKDVEWKGSVQSYIAHAPVKMKRAKDSLWAGRLDVNRTIKQMTICERGKKRNIHAIMIDSRVIQGHCATAR